MSKRDNPFNRKAAATLARRLREPRRFLQAVTGPRQVGKTTLVQQAVAESGVVARFASADEPALRDGIWIAQQWEAARAEGTAHGRAVLVLDKIQKIPSWSEPVKRH
jgi:predicted AAA+ superfamily ATPase